MADNLKDQRRAWKTSVTKQINKVNQLVAEERTDKVKDEIEQLLSKFENFEKAHDQYHETLTDNDLVEESDTYFANAQNDYINALKQAKAWLKNSVNEMQPTDRKVESTVKEEASSKDVVAALSMPKVEIPVFDGNPLDYHSFITIFDESVSHAKVTNKAKLTRLIQYTSNRAYNAIRGCSLMDENTGYTKAREILRQRFGNSHLVTERLISSLRDGKPIRNPEELQAFCDELDNCNLILNQMNKLHEVQNQSFIVQICDRLQPYIKNRWKKHAMDIKKSKDRYPNFEEFVEFVREQTVEAVDPVYGNFSTSSYSRNSQKNLKANTFSSDVGKYAGGNCKSECVLCKASHRLFYCSKFKDLKPVERLNVVMKHKLCENCLLSNHTTENCKKSSVCSVPGCGRRHTKFIHISDKQENKSDSAKNVRLLNANTSVSSDVYMPVVAVRVNDKHDTCALLDTASSASFCTKSLLNAVNISGSPVTYSLNTLGTSQNVDSTVVNLSLVSLDGQESLEISNVYVVDSIPFRSSCPEPGVHPHLKGLQLVAGDQEVGLLLGQDNAEALVPIEIKKGAKSEPFACRTLFGWSVNGPCRVDGPINRKVVSQFISASIEEEVHNLWKLENDGLCKSNGSWSQEDRRVVEFWDKKCQFSDGHYEIPIPWKPGVDLPNNYPMAAARLKSIKVSLEKRCLFQRYDQEIKKLLHNGYAEEIPIFDLKRSEGVWFLPHHGVISSKKPEKLRMVFDCAAKFRGESLNDKCYRGPCLTNNLFDVLVRFREHSVAIQADIEAMYYQVKVPREERDCLRFLWYDVDGTIKQYRMTGHVFGGVWCSSSSTYALRRCVLDNDHVNSVVTDCINRGFYVDDCLKSVPDVDKARSVIFGTQELLSRGGFNLTKFIVNDNDILQSIPEDHRAKEAKEIGSSIQGKALGVNWDVSKDCFYVDVQVATCEKISRRNMLSVVSSCFDPLGLISPLLVEGKLLFQEATWRKLLWDDSIPADLLELWNGWIVVLQQLCNFRVPRCIKPFTFNDSYIELHHFSDASLKAYGTCTYVRCVNKVGDIHTLLVASKGKVAPMKVTTIPRLELQAAVLSVKMDEFLRAELETELGPSHFWVDSQLVLCYIHNETRRFHMFVGNRVSQIRELSEPNQWFHIPGKDNPADLITKKQGLTSFDTKKWLHGPEFLMKHKCEWKVDKGFDLEIPVDDPEAKREVRVNLSRVDSSPKAVEKLVSHYSSWHKLLKAVAWFRRFGKYLKGHKTCESSITAGELKGAEIAILRHVQREVYPKESAAIVKGEGLSKDSSIKCLSPIADESGLLRVGGRLRFAADAVCAQPIIIPHSHPIALCIIEDFHRIAHLGTEWVVSLVRQKYWITKIRVLVKSVSRKCLICKRLFAPVSSQMMADLPEERLESHNVPFTYTGMDCFGPYLVKQGRSTVKRYGCVFTCLSVRAVHIERLCSLDTDSFICALRRFVARRGTPDKIFCDNGTNFVGACTELRTALKQLDDRQIHDECLKREIEFHFSPPTASHMGGVWERMIRVIRKVMSGTLNVDARMSDEMLETVFSEVEAIINGRPLTKVSDDPKDPSALTPNHFLLLGSAQSSAPGVFSAGDMYRRRWRFVQHLVDKFWKLWLSSYIPELQKRSKWLKRQPNFAVGDLVLISDERVPRNVWPMGIVVDTKFSRDGLVRSVEVKTKSSVLLRPVHKLVHLEATA